MSNDREIQISLLLDAPPEKVWRCWTEPELLKQCFAPKPWTTPSAVMDVRPGGKSLITMRSPEGQDIPNAGLYLEVIPNRKLVFTDAFVDAWTPKDGAPFFVATIELSNEGGKTRYVATARHWTKENCDQHKAMGFEPGWTVCARQIEALAQTL